ncbi:MAG: aspartate kinase [Bacteroidetes bacterium]|nr:aspartate kinase [Bacteroidota bacterium]
MQILKFGGASVRDADGVRNLEKVLQHVGTEKTLIVISAMGKTTNALEKVIEHYFNSKHELQSSIQDVKKYHNGILLELFENESHEVFQVVTALFRELSEFFDRNKSPDYSFVYDQTIGFGELISTTIVSYYLNHKGVKNKWLDVRELIKTNSYYRNAKVEWALTQSKISEAIDEKALHITQGFLGSDGNNFTTTLGREGSDYTAAIFAFCLNAKSVTIWKDVPGVLNAAPRFFENPTLLDSLSYEEAIELSYYGASVIHPKTLQPLQQKEIPLYVKCFLEPKNKGTKVGKSVDLSPNVPCYILRKDQILITVSSLDFSYIVEENISHIFKLLHLYKMKVRSIQNSAISFSVCIENSYNHLDPLILQLKAKYNVRLDKAVDLYTIRHYTTDAIEEIQKNKTVLMKQITPKTVQIITK